MAKIAHIIGNGSSASFYKPSKGLKLTCNLPPFAVDGVYATTMVDFKIMHAIYMEEIIVPGEWILGARPKVFMERHPSFHIKHASQIKEFYTELPVYAGNFTNWNCGHMATHFAANKFQADEIHMYGFNSIFDPDLRSCTDFYLGSNRANTNMYRLNENWRPIWSEMFKEFAGTQFVLYSTHDKILTDKPENVEIRISKK
jgi:hypothetical protein